MPNLATTLKAEISRLARKELRKEIHGLKKTVAAHRSEIATLKKKLAEYGREAKRTGPASPRVEQKGSGDQEASSRIRFSAKGFASQRKRLELSAADLALLFGVSSQTIYNWEDGTSRPYPKHLPAIAALRTLGKRAAAQLIADRK